MAATPNDTLNRHRRELAVAIIQKTYGHRHDSQTGQLEAYQPDSHSLQELLTNRDYLHQLISDKAHSAEMVELRRKV